MPYAQSMAEVEAICERNTLDQAERHCNEVLYGGDYEDTHTLTTELREMLVRNGMKYTTGCYVISSDETVDDDSVTTIWPIEDDPISTLTFEENDGRLELVDTYMTPHMALRLAQAILDDPALSD